MSENLLGRSDAVQLLTSDLISLRLDKLPHALIKDGTRLLDTQDLAASDLTQHVQEVVLRQLHFRGLLR